MGGREGRSEGGREERNKGGRKEKRKKAKEGRKAIAVSRPLIMKFQNAGNKKKLWERQTWLLQRIKNQKVTWHSG